MSLSIVKSRPVGIGLLVLALLATIVLLALPAAAETIDVTRAELKGGDLRIEGEGAAAGAEVTVTSPESTASNNAENDGKFRVEAGGFQSSTCEATVSDGVSSVQVTLSGCTPSAQPTATATSEPTATPVQQPTATATPQPTATPLVEPTATATPPPPTATPTSEPTATATPQQEEPRIASLTFDPNPVPGGTIATGIIVFTKALPEDTLVHLQSNRDDLAAVPSQLIAPAGAIQVTYPVTTTAPFVDTTFFMFATAFAVTKATELTVLAPPPPPDADTVEITKAVRKDAILEVEATSTSSNATLTVHHIPSGSFIMTLENRGGGKYEGERQMQFPIDDILVKSSLGGEDTALVIEDD